jgi:hypothetical protein
VSKTWAPEWEERWDGPRDQSSRRKSTESALAFLHSGDEPEEDKYAYVWKRWENPEYRDHRRREAVLAMADNAKLQHFRLGVYAAAHGQQYADDLRQWLRDQDALAELTEDAAAWIATRDFRPYEPGYIPPYSLEAKRAREAMQASAGA